jgi:gluconolactonase
MAQHLSGPSSLTGQVWIQRVKLATEKVETLYTHCDGISLHGPTDIVFDAQGGFWFTEGPIPACARER